MLPWSFSLEVSQAMLLLTLASSRVVICCQTAQALKIIIPPAVPCFLFEMGQVKTIKALITNRYVCKIYFSCIKTKPNRFYVLKQKWNMSHGSAKTYMSSPFRLGFIVWAGEYDWPGLFLKGQVPLRFKLSSLDSESRPITMIPWKMVWFYILVVSN